MLPVAESLIYLNAIRLDYLSMLAFHQHFEVFQRKALDIFLFFFRLCFSQMWSFRNEAGSSGTGDDRCWMQQLCAADKCIHRR